MTRLSSGLLLCSLLLIILDYVRPYPHLIEIDDAFDRINRLDPNKRGTDPRCRQCANKEDCLREPLSADGKGCRWGTFIDRCGHVNCLRGPDEFCDLNSPLDRCEPTLLCKCNRCKGCLKDGEGNYLCYYGNGKPCLSDLSIPRNPKF